MKHILSMLIWLLFVQPAELYSQVTIVEWKSEKGTRIATAGVGVNRYAEIAREPEYEGTYNFFGSENNELTTSGWVDGWDTKYWVITINTYGFNNIRLTSYHRGSDTGPRYFRINYSLDGGETWQDVPGSAFQVENNDYVTGVVNNRLLPEAVSDQEEVKIRWLMTSNSAINHNPVTNNGNSRIKDINITGEPVKPFLSVETTGISGLQYDLGSGPSFYQAFTLKGYLLSGEKITLSAPAGFEVATPEEMVFGSMISLISHEDKEYTILVRLAEGLVADVYEGELIIMLENIEVVYIPLQGLVFSPQVMELPWKENFAEGLGSTYVYNASGNQRQWEASPDGYAFMDGYNTGDLEVDWLILPALIRGKAVNPVLTFNSWFDYGADDENNYLKLLYSANYTGMGDPVWADWNVLPFDYPDQAETWSGSDELELAGLQGDTIHLAFLYVYAPDSYREWRIRNIAIYDLGEPEPLPELTHDGYSQNFSEFSGITTLPNGWNVSEDVYQGDWGTGTSAGLRGNADVLGYQHTATTGMFSVTVTLINRTGSIIENLDISYVGKVKREVERSPDWTVEVGDHMVDDLFYSTNWGKDSLLQARVTNLSINEGEEFTIRWTSDGNVPGSGARRQIGIGEVNIAAYPIIPVFRTSLTGTPGFRLISAPVPVNYQQLLGPVWTDLATGGDEQQSFEDMNVWKWDKNISGDTLGLLEPVVEPSRNIDTGEGILLYWPGKSIEDDSGETGLMKPIEIIISGNEHSLPVTLPANEYPEGFALLGNPVGTPLVWDAIKRFGVSDVVYVWDPGGRQWLTRGINGIGDLAGGIIQPFQGFFVYTHEEAKGAGLEITDGSRVDKSTLYPEAESDIEPMLIRLQVEGEGLAGSAWLYFSEDGDIDMDAGDGLQLQPFSTEYVILASRSINGKLLDINHLPIPTEPFEIPLVVSSTRNGSYTLSISHKNLPECLQVTITDMETGEIITFDTLTAHQFLVNAKTKEKSEYPKTIIDGRLMANNGRMGDRFLLSIDKIKATHSDSSVLLPPEFALRQNYPNPFNSSTKIRYELPEHDYVRLAVYDIIGREVAVLVSEHTAAGKHQVIWDASGFSTGLYVYRLEALGQVLVGKMVLLR